MPVVPRRQKRRDNPQEEIFKMSLDIDRLHKPIKRVDKFLKQSPKHPTPETIHQVRELQYVLQLSKMQHQPQMISTLENVKDAIGEWHDSEELVAIASDLLDDGPQSGLVQQLASISNKKFEHVLAVTNKMRAAYIDGKNRKPSRRRASGRTIREACHSTGASCSP
jgi:CHAD domain-containing protein